MRRSTLSNKVGVAGGGAGGMKAHLRGDHTDSCETHLACAKALAVVLCGEGGETFRTYNDEIQDNVLWLLSQEIARATAAYYAEIGGGAA